MARILSIDFGEKRVGVAGTDPLQLIVTGIDTVANKNLMAFLEEYISREEVEKIVFGEPRHSDGTLTKLNEKIDAFILKLKAKYPRLIIDKYDESFSSTRAKEAILKSGAKRKKRRDKALVDKISAIIILQDYLGY